ncbi:winged helix-turn-helix domain-containing protein [Micromonospora profundi]|uniref:Winged helix-turn-helix domain-containing protein n=1 Tax=Micromonospora profundi TaxID=1420889 RepID=A0AAJ6HUH6_9ACTN|nr:winged helix-turn-helix domain-containing protein [Micromonospora profundi]WLS44449.1 winged helix-turn-helix domain-containing protein [Micromonospora profundi]
MAEDDEAATGGAATADEPFPLLIAVTPSPTERIRLAERLDGIAPLLLVADLDELRRLIAPSPAAAPPAPSPTAPSPTAPPPAVPADAVLVIDSTRSTARYGGREVDLTRLEHDLLTCLTTEPVRVWSYAELHRTVWHDEGRERRADVQSLVKRLRRKLLDLGTAATIEAVRGVGLLLSNRQEPRIGRA